MGKNKQRGQNPQESRRARCGLAPGKWRWYQFGTNCLCFGRTLAGCRYGVVYAVSRRSTSAFGRSDAQLVAAVARRLDRAYFRDLKKRLIERQAQGMLEFVEPKWGLDSVIGFDRSIPPSRFKMRMICSW